MSLQHELGALNSGYTTRTVSARVKMELEEALEIAEPKGADVKPSIELIDLSDLKEELVDAFPALGTAVLDAQVDLNALTEDNETVKDAFIAGMLIGYLALRHIPEV